MKLSHSIQIQSIVIIYNSKTLLNNIYLKIVLLAYKQSDSLIALLNFETSNHCLPSYAISIIWFYLNNKRHANISYKFNKLVYYFIWNMCYINIIHSIMLEEYFFLKELSSFKVKYLFCCSSYDLSVFIWHRYII